MQYEFNLSCGRQYELELSAVPGGVPPDDARSTLPPVEPISVVPAPA